MRTIVVLRLIKMHIILLYTNMLIAYDSIPEDDHNGYYDIIINIIIIIEFVLYYIMLYIFMSTK